MSEIANPQRIRQFGHRLTPQRRAILRILEQAQGHLTPGEVYDQAQLAIPGLTETTVYRTLDFLADQGLALVTQTGSGHLVYEIARRNHHHLICRVCGRTIEIDHSILQELYDRFEAQTGFKVDSSHLTFFGRCPDCKDKAIDPTGAKLEPR
jgi:Fur family ferric uptake transcriptional regulator